MRLHRRPPAGPGSRHGDCVASKLHGAKTWPAMQVERLKPETELLSRTTPPGTPPPRQATLAAPTFRRCSSAHAAELVTPSTAICAGGFDLRPTSVEESAAAEQQHHEDDDEQSSRVHFLLPYSSRVIRHPTVCGEHEPVSVQLRTPLTWANSAATSPLRTLSGKRFDFRATMSTALQRLLQLGRRNGARTWTTR